VTNFARITHLAKIMKNSKHQIPNLKQIPMTKIQKSKQRIRLPLGPTASSLAHWILSCGALKFWRMFWSLNIEI
jgi:hypothetical protein